MTSAQLVNLKGKSVGEVTLDEAVFGIEPNQDLLFDALHRQLTNARRGTANAKTRSEVRGGGRKPWRQKGTGRARAGSSRSPLWAGGGVVFGPKPRDYSISMPKKMRQAALKSALASKKDALVIVKDFSDIKEAKTKVMASALKDLGLTEKKTLLVLDYACEQCEVVQRAARNIATVKVVSVQDLNVKDILDADTLLTFERVIGVISGRFKGQPMPARVTTSGGKKEKAEKAPAAKATKVKAASSEGSAPAKAPRKKAEPKAEGGAPKATIRKKKEDQ